MTLGVVLAGGKSSRMGRDKASLPFEGRTFADRVAFALGAVCDDVVVVGTDLPGWRSIPDDGDAHRGPLSGIATGLREANDGVLVCAVDHPAVRVETLRALAALATDRPVVPVDGEVPQVTIGWYPSSLADAFTAQLADGGFIRRALDTLDVRWVLPEEWTTWGEDGSSWRSVDTPGEYGELRSPL